MPNRLEKVTVDIPFELWIAEVKEEEEAKQIS